MRYEFDVFKFLGDGVEKVMREEVTNPANSYANTKIFAFIDRRIQDQVLRVLMDGIEAA